MMSNEIQVRPGQTWEFRSILVYRGQVTGRHGSGTGWSVDIEPPIIGKGLDWFSDDSFRNGVMTFISDAPAPEPPPPEPPKPVVKLHRCAGTRVIPGRGVQPCETMIQVVSGRLCPTCEAKIASPCATEKPLPHGTWTPSPGFCAPMLSRGMRR